MSLWSRIERRLGELAGEILPDEYRVQIDEARQLIRDGKPQEAARSIEALLGDRPDHEMALALLGEAYLAVGAPDKARDAFARALRVDGEYPEALLGLGDALLALGEPAAAAGRFRAALSAAGGKRAVLAEAYRGLGMARLGEGDHDRAIRELRKAVAEAPDDARALAALGEAIARAPDRESREARRHLERAAQRDGCPPQAFLALGLVFLEDDDPALAEDYFRRAIDAGDAAVAGEARLGLAEARRELGDPEGALEILEEARPRRSADPQLWARFGDACADADRNDEALGHYRRALLQGADADVARRALALILDRDLDADAAELANRVLEDARDDALALAARGRDFLRAGAFDAAEGAFTAAAAAGEDPRVLSARADLAARRMQHAEAARLALAALRLDPHRAHAREILLEARAGQLGVEVDDADHYQLAEALRRVCLATPTLSDLAAAAADAAADFDRPLLLTVMGEFSSGKSSFVNAFIGDDVAPTGITPTTATINFVKYGREQGARTVAIDGRVEDHAWSEAGDALRKINSERARTVRYVELRLPLPVLSSVNIVDTPGLNSILPEHEETARDFITRADAVVWLFTAQQAGKATEREALDELRAEGVRVLAVLNKVDQLSDSELEEVLGYVRSELGDRVIDVVPLSAQRALKGEEGSHWQPLMAVLEERFFSRARELKSQACDRRLHSLLGVARERFGDGDRSGDRVFLAAAESLAERRLQFIDEVAAAERAAVAQDGAALYRLAASEILELVRPRSLPFGSHKATRADRDYLIGLLESGYCDLLDQSFARVEASLRSHFGEALALGSGRFGDRAGEVERVTTAGVRMVEASVYDRCKAYVAGYLRGGFVDHFFRVEIARLELEKDAVYHALYKDAPDLDAILAVPLAQAGGRALGDVAELLERIAGEREVARLDARAGVEGALDRIEERRVALRGDG